MPEIGGGITLKVNNRKGQTIVEAEKIQRMPVIQIEIQIP